MTTYFGMHMSLTFIHNLCYVSYCFEVIKGFKRSKKVKKGHFFLIWKWLKKWSIYFFKGKKTIPIPFFHKKNAWNFFFWFLKKVKFHFEIICQEKRHAQNNGPNISTTNQHNWGPACWRGLIRISMFVSRAV